MVIRTVKEKMGRTSNLFAATTQRINAILTVAPKFIIS